MFAKIVDIYGPLEKELDHLLDVQIVIQQK